MSEKRKYCGHGTDITEDECYKCRYEALQVRFREKVKALEARDRAHAEELAAAKNYSEALKKRIEEKVKERNRKGQLLGEAKAELSAVREERDRLKHLHELDHSLADQWQKKNEALEAELAEAKSREDAYYAQCFDGNGNLRESKLKDELKTLRAALRELIRVCRYGSSGPESLPALYNRLEALTLTPEAAARCQCKPCRENRPQWCEAAGKLDEPLEKLLRQFMKDCADFEWETGLRRKFYGLRDNIKKLFRHGLDVGKGPGKDGGV